MHMFSTYNKLVTGELLKAVTLRVDQTRTSQGALPAVRQQRAQDPGW